MLKSEDIKEIIINSIKETITDNKDININDHFIGPNSTIESIDIVQIISSIEDSLESHNIKGFDLFDSIFKFDKLTFEELTDVIEKELNEFKHDSNFR